jgi:hypothetical protein
MIPIVKHPLLESKKSLSEIPRHVYNKAACQIGYAFGKLFTYAKDGLVVVPSDGVVMLIGEKPIVTRIPPGIHEYMNHPKFHIGSICSKKQLII